MRGTGGKYGELREEMVIKLDEKTKTEQQGENSVCLPGKEEEQGIPYPFIQGFHKIGSSLRKIIQVKMLDIMQ